MIESLRANGDYSPLNDVQSASVGGVSGTRRLRTDHGDYFLGWNATPWFGNFTNEAFHPSLLRATNMVGVPTV